MLLTNSAEGGTSGVNVTTANSGSPSGPAFDQVTAGGGAGGILTFDNAHAAHGTLAYKHAIGTTADECYYMWSTATGGTFSRLNSAVNFYVTANPGTTHKLISTLGGATVGARVSLNTTGKLVTSDSGGGTVATSTNSVPLNQWFRVEFDVTGSTTAGVITCRLYSGADDSTPLEVLSNSAQNTGTVALDRIRVGPTGTPVASVTIWSDDPQVSDPHPGLLVHTGGKQWRRRFRHTQVPLPPQAAAAAAVVAPPPLIRPVIVSRLPVRARIGRLGLCAAGVASAVVTPLGSPPPTRPPQPVTPHVAHRAHVGPTGACAGGVASAVVTPRGSMPSPMPRPVIQHLPPNRAVIGPVSLPAAGVASAVVTPRGTPGPGWRALPRRPGPSRAVWRGAAGPQPAAAGVVTAYQRPPPPPRSPASRRGQSRGYASAVVTPRGTPGPLWRAQPRRPSPGRAVWRGGAGPPAVAAPAAQAYQHPQPLPRSRPPRRAVWHGLASTVVTPLGTPARRPGPQITSRPRSRAVWHGNAGPQPTVVTPPPRCKPLPPRRRPQRAVLRRGIGLANAAPPPFSIGVLTAATAPAATLGAANTATDALTASTAPQGTLTAATADAGMDIFTDTFGDIFGDTPAAVLTATTSRSGGPS